MWMICFRFCSAVLTSCYRHRYHDDVEYCDPFSTPIRFFQLLLASAWVEILQGWGGGEIVVSYDSSSPRAAGGPHPPAGASTTKSVRWSGPATVWCIEVVMYRLVPKAMSFPVYIYRSSGEINNYNTHVTRRLKLTAAPRSAAITCGDPGGKQR